MTDTVIDTGALAPTNAREQAMLALGKSIDTAMRHVEGETGSIASIAAGIIKLVNSGNGVISLPFQASKGETIDVELSASTLAHYAARTLPRVKGETLPRSADVLGALFALSPKVGAAQTAEAKADAAVKATHSKIRTKRERAEQSSDLGNFARDLDGVRQPVRRAGTLAAYVLNLPNDDGEPYYDLASVKVVGRALWATPAGLDAEGKPYHAEDVPLALAESEMGPKRAPRAAKSNETDGDKAHVMVPGTGMATNAKGDVTSVTIRDEALRPSGTDRDALADAIKGIAGYISDLGKPTPAEREALQRLWRAVTDKLDDDAIVAANGEAHDAPAAAE